MFSNLLIVLSVLSTAFGTSDLGLGVTPDPVLLPNVVPGEHLNVAVSEAAAPPKAETFLDKLAAPFAFLQSGLPCLGQSSLKAGNCKEFTACAADGGFQDGKGLCLGQAICCVKPVKCGEISVLNNTVMANPGFPGATDQTGTCVVKLVKPFGVSHVRLFISDLELAQPDHFTGKCEEDSLSVKGGVAPNFGIQKICGLISKTHLYFPTVLELADIFVEVKLADNAAIKRRWLIRAEFIEAKSAEKPPTGCAQYFREESGLITSLNFDAKNKTGLGNIDGLNYGICFADHSGTCSIKFTSVFFNLGGKISSHALESSVIPSRVARAAPVYRPMARPAYVNRPTNYYYPSQGLHAPTYKKKPFYGPKTRPQGYRPVYHRPSYVEAHRYPFSPFLVKLPFGAISTYMNRPMALYPSNYYKAPMKKPEVDLDKLENKLDGKLDGKLDKLEGLADKLDEKLGLKPEGELNIPKVCPDQDTVIFPIPDDGTSPIHCGDEFHFGGEMISSFSPFKILVVNKGLHHGKGFAISYKIQC